MIKLYRKIKDWLYSTLLGSLYLEFLLFLDKKEEKKFLTYKEAAQIIRESSKLAEGTLAIKTKVNSLVASRTKEEYEAKLSEIQELLTLSEYSDVDSSRKIYVDYLRNMGNMSKIVDVENATDRAKMIDTKINAMYELQRYNEKKQMAKDIKKAKQENNETELLRLKEEFKKKYGR